MGRFSGHNDENTGFKGFLKRKKSLPGAVKQVSKRKFRFRGTLTGFFASKTIEVWKYYTKTTLQFCENGKMYTFWSNPP